MKNDLELETVQEGAYDWVLFLSFVLLLPIAFCVTVISKVRFVMASLRDIDGDDAREKRRRAFDLHGRLIQLIDAALRLLVLHSLPDWQCLLPQCLAWGQRMIRPTCDGTSKDGLCVASMRPS